MVDILLGATVDTLGGTLQDSHTGRAIAATTKEAHTMNQKPTFIAVLARIERNRATMEKRAAMSRHAAQTRATGRALYLIG